MVKKAIKFAMRIHEEQERKKTGLPYVLHVYEVFKKLSLITNDVNTLVAGLLHDAIEDTTITHEQITIEFNREIADIVLECTRYSDQETKAGKYEFLESFKTKSTASILIKIADRHSNVFDYRVEEIGEEFKDEEIPYSVVYALQAYPLIQAYIRRQGDNHDVDAVHKLIDDMQQLIYTYTDIDLESNPSDIEDTIKEIVL
jgi:hypothetical protein